MAKIELNILKVQIEIPDLIIAETVIKRKALFSQMIYDQDAKSVKLVWTVQHYAKASDGSYGEYIGNAVADYFRSSVADNSTMCDIASGHPIEKIDVGGGEMDYDENINYVGQYDFFHYVGDNQPILVNNMIRIFGGLVPDWSKQ